MNETVHIIPVGFDYERLLHPISKDGLDADRVRLLHSSRETSDEEVRELAETMVDKLEYSFTSHLDIQVNIESVDEIFDYKQVYRKAFEMISEEIDDENEVWINISSMPRTVAFAFATAANTLIVENSERRESIHTYYVSPEKYHLIDMYQELKRQMEFLHTLNEQYEAAEIEERAESVENLLAQIDRSGMTKGAKELESGKRYVEFPATPSADLREFEITILQFLDNAGAMPSTSQLATQLADHLGQNDDESFRSKVQYNAGRLEAKGFLHREKQDKSFKTELSTMGELWLATHEENGENKVIA